MSPFVLVIILTIGDAYSPAPATVIDMPSKEACEAAMTITKNYYWKSTFHQVGVSSVFCLDRR